MPITLQCVTQATAYVSLLLYHFDDVEYLEAMAEPRAVVASTSNFGPR